MSNEKSISRREDKNVERVDQMRSYAPAVDIFEDQDEILMLADMPGVTLEAVDINFEKSQLTLQGRCSCLPDDANDPGFLYVRKFVVPGGIDAGKIGAELKHGVLMVHLPKHDSLRPRQIAVKGG